MQAKIDALIKTDESFNTSLDEMLASGSLPRSQSNNSFSSLPGAREPADCGGAHEVRSLQEEAASALRSSPDKVLSIPSLTEAQQRAITGATHRPRWAPY